MVSTMEQTKTSKSAKSFFNILKNMTSTPDELPKLRYHVADDVVNFADIPHRIDDLERLATSTARPLMIPHRIDDLEKCQW